MLRGVPGGRWCQAYASAARGPGPGRVPYARHGWMSAHIAAAAQEPTSLGFARAAHADEPGRRRQVLPVRYDRAAFPFGELAVHPKNRPTIQPIKPENGMGASGAKTRRPMSESGSIKSGYGPDQSGMLSMARTTPMPCPASTALETISGARKNSGTLRRDIAVAESHTADRADPKFGDSRQVTYKATNPQFMTAKSRGS